MLGIAVRLIVIDPLSAITQQEWYSKRALRGVFGKYVDKFNRMRIKYTRQMKFWINEYHLLNIKYDQYENLALINDLDIGH